jgi:hypothetical protein
MDIRNTLTLEVTKEKNTYSFNLPTGATYGEAYDAAFEVLNKLIEMQQEALKKSQEEYDKTKETK